MNWDSAVGSRSGLDHQTTEEMTEEVKRDSQSPVHHRCEEFEIICEWAEIRRSTTETTLGRSRGGQGK